MFFLSTCPPHQISEKRTSYLQGWEFTAEGFARTCARIPHICLKVFIPSIFALRCQSAIFNNCLHALRQNLKACNAEDSVTLKHAIDSVGLAHTHKHRGFSTHHTECLQNAEIYLEIRRTSCMITRTLDALADPREIEVDASTLLSVAKASVHLFTNNNLPQDAVT